jgi:tetratricopeptide (TPR) repeat protein
LLGLAAASLGWEARVYLKQGKFEQAIELMRMLDHSPLEEAHVCLEYGVFENQVERPDESRAYLERAKKIFESVGASGGLLRVEA